MSFWRGNFGNLSWPEWPHFAWVLVYVGIALGFAVWEQCYGR